MSVEVKTNLWPKIRANLSLANKSYAAVGWPSEKPQTQKIHDPVSGMTNVEVAATLNLGRPKIGREPAIPARPFMDALFAKHLSEYKDAARKALKMISEGQMSTKIALEQIGRLAQGDLFRLFAEPGDKAYVAGQAGGWKMANAPRTIMQKGSDTPLTDSGNIRGSITWVVRMKGTK